MNRIELIASLCKGSECVCDIGCDHAYVLIECIKKYDVKRGIAADVAAGPLSAAGDNISAMHLNSKIEMVLSDGFQMVNSHFDTAVIAGMGGFLIRDILAASLDKIQNKRLILEPNTDQPLVRKYVIEHGFQIVDEYAIYDMNKYYEIMVISPGKMILSEEEITYGPYLLRKRPEAFLKKLNEKRNMLKGVLLNIKNEEAYALKMKELCSIERILNSND